MVLTAAAEDRVTSVEAVGQVPEAEAVLPPVALLEVVEERQLAQARKVAVAGTRGPTEELVFKEEFIALDLVAGGEATDLGAEVVIIRPLETAARTGVMVRAQQP